MGAEKCPAEKCPKDNLPARTTRMKRGKRVFICDNGHDFTASDRVEAANHAESPHRRRSGESLSQWYERQTGRPLP